MDICIVNSDEVVVSAKQYIN